MNVIDRAYNIINRLIESLELDLSGLNVLTEVGSNNYIFLPIICSMAGAEKVFAWTKDSLYGKGEKNKELCLSIVKRYGIDSKIEFVVNDFSSPHLQQADIITNSGFIRPIDEGKIIHLKKEAVIPLMYDKWEFREDEIDIQLCKRKGIKVAGTWENHPSIKVFEYIGYLAAKMVFETGFEILNNSFVVWSNDDFGKYISKAFIDMGAKKVLITNNHGDLERGDKYNVLFICDYFEKRELIGRNGILDINIVKNSFESVIHLLGRVDSDFLSKRGIGLYPKYDGCPSKMSFTLSHLGIEPILRLQTASLKVAQCLCYSLESNLVQRIC